MGCRQAPFMPLSHGSICQSCCSLRPPPLPCWGGGSPSRCTKGTVAQGCQWDTHGQACCLHKGPRASQKLPAAPLLTLPMRSCSLSPVPPPCPQDRNTDSRGDSVSEAWQRGSAEADTGYMECTQGPWGLGAVPAPRMRRLTELPSDRQAACH